MPHKKFLGPLAALSITVYFVALTRDARLSYFSADDLMNLYRSWANPAGALVKANLLFFLNSAFGRALPSAWLRILYDFAGFHPAPFHVANLILIAANVWITYCVARRLTESREAGALAALIIAYQPGFAPLYFDTAYIYDVLCYFFYFSAFLYYIRIRSEMRPLRWREVALLSALYICALDSKEMAVTLPLFLAIYELLYRRAALEPWTKRGGVDKLRQWFTSDGLGLLTIALLTVLFTIGRALGSASLLHNADYQPSFTPARFVETSDNFIQSLFLFARPPHPAYVIALWAAMFAIAWRSKSRPLKFAWLFLMLSPIPVAFIASRSAPQYYIPLFGWVLYAAAGLAIATRRLFRPASDLADYARALALFCIAGAVLFAINERPRWASVNAVSIEGEGLRSIDYQIHQLRPALPRNARVLFLDDPIDDPWRMMFLMRLSYRDRSLIVDRARYMQPAPDARQIASYEYVFDYRYGRFYTSPQPRISGPQPVIVFESGRPSVFHLDWSPVTPNRPARAGEEIIAMMTDLGATVPPQPPGQPFPDSPLLQVASPISITVDGRPADVVVKIGWPQAVNRYRVDFRMPQNIRPGNADVQVTCGGLTGPVTEIPAAGS